MGGAALLRLLERARNVEEIEELLVAAAVHPDGAGFARAQLLRFEPQSERLTEVRHLSGADPGATLTEWLQQVRTRTNGNGHGNGHGNGNGALEAAKLEGVCAAAWSRGGIALGHGASNGGPWPGPATGAVVLHRGVQPYAMLVGEWESDEHAEHRPAALESLRQLAVRIDDIG